MSFPTSAVVDANKHLLALCNNGNMIWSATNKTANNEIASNGEQLTTATIFSPRQSGLTPLRRQPHGDAASPLFNPETATRKPPLHLGCRFVQQEHGQTAAGRTHRFRRRDDDVLDRKWSHPGRTDRRVDRQFTGDRPCSGESSPSRSESGLQSVPMDGAGRKAIPGRRYRSDWRRSDSRRPDEQDRGWHLRWA